MCATRDHRAPSSAAPSTRWARRLAATVMVVLGSAGLMGFLISLLTGPRPLPILAGLFLMAGCGWLGLRLLDHMDPGPRGRRR